MASLEENSVFEQQYHAMTALELVREMNTVRLEKERMEETLSTINKRYDYLRLIAVPKRFEDDGITNMKVEGVGRVGLTSDLYASIAPDQKGAAYEWLSDNGHGDVVQPTVNSSTLKALMKSIIKSGEEIPSELFKVTPFTRASITKS